MVNCVHQRLIYVYKNVMQYSVYVTTDRSHKTKQIIQTISLFTVNFSDLHYNVIQRGCEAISG